MFTGRTECSNRMNVPECVPVCISVCACVIPGQGGCLWRAALTFCYTLKLKVHWLICRVWNGNRREDLIRLHWLDWFDWFTVVSLSNYFTCPLLKDKIRHLIKKQMSNSESELSKTYVDMRTSVNWAIIKSVIRLFAVHKKQTCPKLLFNLIR